MKTTQLINTAEAQELKKIAQKIGFIVFFSEPPKYIGGSVTLINMEGSADKFLKLATYVKPDQEPKLFSNWSAGSIGRYKRIKRTILRAPIKPSEMFKEMKQYGCSEHTIKNARDYLCRSIVNKGFCRLSISYPGGGGDRLTYHF